MKKIALALALLALPMSAHAGSPGLLEWHLEEKNDPITDAKSVSVGYGDTKAMIMMQCAKGKFVTVLIPVDPMVALEFMQRQDTVPVEWRVGANAGHSDTWFSFRTPGGTGHQIGSMGLDIPKEMVGGQDNLVVRAHGMTFAFPLAGSSDKIGKAMAACS